MAGRKIKIKKERGLDIEFDPDQSLSAKQVDDVLEIIKKFTPMQLENYEEYDEQGNLIDNEEDWKPVALDISKIHPKKFSEVADIPFANINDYVKMENGQEGYFNTYSELNYYTYRYQIVNQFHPNVYRFDQFNMNLFIRDLFKYNIVPENSYIKNTYQGSDTARLTSFIIAFSKKLLLYVDGVDKGILYYDITEEHDKDSFFNLLLALLKTYKRPKVAKNKIFIVHRNSHGFEKTGFTVSKLKVDLTENYNDDFPEMSEKIIEGLNSKLKTNLVILSGEPGTGKTTFIRYLASHLKKNIIFISPDMVDYITDPAFIPFLMQNNDSILIIEDAEPALEKRSNGGRNSAVSNVLNLTDGLLSDCLKISIVATFNTKERNIDEALTRKGRLLMNYKFERLSIDKSKNLLEKLGHTEVTVEEPMTLADIYFYGTDNNTINFKTKKIGFAK